MMGTWAMYPPYTVPQGHTVGSDGVRYMVGTDRADTQGRQDRARGYGETWSCRGEGGGGERAHGVGYGKAVTA